MASASWPELCRAWFIEQVAQGNSSEKATKVPDEVAFWRAWHSSSHGLQATLSGAFLEVPPPSPHTAAGMAEGGLDRPTQKKRRTNEPTEPVLWVVLKGRDTKETKRAA
ncbi:hypothetical protein CIHG_08299 [Coccidioides immitis H538.4]|uniref:Uncharacterized protein n=3 Tax=Coccidioides immitis TaxID=5501 RepID=A0A0J8QPR6_COCIT|nr:hypothetical protein CIRG_02287 [Coccidioides immitis RMSCC 2394]KMU74519.1 hypothetical protein CISG_04227 [Coccidioides immitis RMSCC 3703]KMU90583.1 hypothetical protein CIHG_08299 [Coccidioides immitis H538.4]